MVNATEEIFEEIVSYADSVDDVEREERDPAKKEYA